MATVKRRKLEHEQSSGSDSPSFASFSSESEESASEDERKPNSEEKDGAEVPTTQTSNGNAIDKVNKQTNRATEEAEPRDEDTSAAPMKTFQDLGIIDPLCQACTALGFRNPTPIQVESIPWALQDRDLIGLAETGSGKTAAFALPILQALLEKPQSKFALVLAPTRELAIQTSQQFSALGSLIAVKTAVIVGGMQEVEQAIALAKEPHIVVATPGRLLYHLENTKGFHLKKLRYLVLDEADRLLDMNFGKEIDKILTQLPRESRHTYLFSATMSSGVASLQRASLRNPVRVSITSPSTAGTTASSSRPKHTTVKSLVQRYLFRPHKEKDLYLLHLLTTQFAGHTAIVFARTVRETARLTYLLRALGLGAIPLHGDLSQSARLSALNKFRARARDILVATDVAARGLDVPNVDLVLNYDLPGDDTTYVHRVGRTARAGKGGCAVSFVSQYDVEVWLRIERALGRKVEELGVGGEEEVRVLEERVGEAQRLAVRAVREGEEKKKKGRGGPRGKRRREDVRDVEEG